MSTLRDLGVVLTGVDKKAAAGLIAVFVVMACLEVIGVSALFWFVSLVAEPARMESSTIIRRMNEFLGIEGYSKTILVIGVLLFFAFLARNGFALFNLYAQERFLRGRYVALAERLVRVYLDKPIQFFATRNSSELSKNVLIELWRLLTALLMPIVDVTAKLITAAALVGFLLWQNFAVSFSIMAVLAVACGLLYLPLRHRLRGFGGSLMVADTDRFRSLSELFGSVKDVRVLGREPFFVARFVDAARRHARFNLSLRVLSNIPHYALEIFAISIIIAVVLAIQFSTAEPGAAVASAAMYAAAGYRLLPVVKSVMLTLTEMRVGQPVLDVLRDDLVAGKQIMPQSWAEAPHLPFVREIRLENVKFAYNVNSTVSLRDIDLVIPQKNSVAFVGPTGAGKTTLVDLILGLMVPTSGRILIDGLPLGGGNERSWRANIGYVPQHIFLTDDSIRRNIAFGIPDEAIDDDAVRRAAKAASIDAFIQRELPDGYDTVVGERGVRLSGGERQRIGIARALYQDPVLLVLDEATSALDGRTEAVIGEAIANLSHEVTLIVIAHRLSTVKDCDIIHLMEHGRIVDSGSFDDLIRRNDTFRAMARA